MSFSFSQSAKSTLSIIAIMLVNVVVFAQQPKPVYQFLSNPGQFESGVRVEGPSRILKLKGRSGVNTTSINSYIEFPNHTLNSNTGTMTFWIFSLEDISTTAKTPGMGIHNPEFSNFPILADTIFPRILSRSRFSFVYNTGWHPQFWAQFAKGAHWRKPQKAMASTNFFYFRKNTWYNLALTWDMNRKVVKIYANGILIGHSDMYFRDFYRERIAQQVYAGSPAFCFSELKFFKEVLSGEELYCQYKNEVTDYDPQFEKELKHIFAGQDLKDFTWKPEKEWKNQLSLSLKEPAQLDTLYKQGITSENYINEEGMLVQTPDCTFVSSNLHNQVYFWIKNSFEGDIYVEFDFKPLKNNGLSLLMVQATGMNGEDFMADYPLRTCGKMSMVCWEDVRNYHWEYYREMHDTRHDILTGAMMKNPYDHPLAFGTHPKPLEVNTWHKLQFLQQGNHLIGAINGKIIVDAYDSGFNNSGPVLNRGRVAIRCMMHTRIVFRNLNIYNKDTEYTIEKIVMPLKLNEQRDTITGFEQKML